MTEEEKPVATEVEVKTTESESGSAGSSATVPTAEATKTEEADLGSVVDLDRWIESVKERHYLPERAFHTLCEMVKDILCEESNVQPVSTPVIVCGDIHGQFVDLLNLFTIGGEIESGKNYVFMGDYVDRGIHSLETFTYLMLLKAKYPNQITLLRGNHESRQITQVYGFYDECMQKYGNPNPWRWCTQVFDYLTLSCIIDGRIFCVHGGLSPDIRTVDQIRSAIPRKQEVPHDRAFCDLLWSDPEEVEGMIPSNRGAGYLFGASVVREFTTVNGLELIARSHQLVQEGYKYSFSPDNLLVTVWSAPNYCYRCGNDAAIMILDETRTPNFKIFKEAGDQGFPQDGANAPSYFL